MPSRATTVTEYMREVPEGYLDALTELREICLQTLRGFKESMEFGMPSYSMNGKIAIAWSSQKDGIQLHILDEQILKNLRPQIKHLDFTKSAIRFKKPEQLDLILIKQILEEVVQTTNSTSKY